MAEQKSYTCDRCGGDVGKHRDYGYICDVQKRPERKTWDERQQPYRDTVISCKVEITAVEHYRLPGGYSGETKPRIADLCPECLTWAMQQMMTYMKLTEYTTEEMQRCVVNDDRE